MSVKVKFYNLPETESVELGPFIAITCDADEVIGINEDETKRVIAHYSTSEASWFVDRSPYFFVQFEVYRA